jgi:UDP-glucose 4-epimerase
MRVLVTGAHGFLGSAIVPALSAAGVDVIAAGRAELAETMAGALPACDAVVHLAGLAHARAPEAEHRRVNTELTLALAAKARGAGVRRFVHASSAKALGERTEGAPANDSTPPAPQSVYGRSKLAAERGLMNIAGLQTVSLRLPLVHGAQAKANFAALLRLCDTGLPLPFAGIDNRRSFLSLASAAEAFLAALRDGPAGAFCVADQPALSTAALVTHLRTGLERPARLVRPGAFMPAFRLGSLRMLSESFELDDARFRSAYGFAGRQSGAALRETARAFAARRGRAR